MKKSIGIYIHIPFCKSKCYYCDFYSACNLELVNDYIDAVCEEIMQNVEILQNRTIDTVYIGGGTPSLIDSKYIVKLMDVIHLFNPDIKEATIEVNPESVTEEKINDYLSVGINRISIGLQSVNDVTLKKIGRVSTIEDFKKAYNVISNKFKNISVDVICGLPDETLDDFQATLDYITTLKNLTHISCYSLEVHENSKLDFLLSNNFLTLPSEEEERNMKHMLDIKLEKEGFERYEISNYSKTGFESIHNLKYWNQEEYLGIGTAASSFLNSTRYTNISDTKKYIENVKSGNSIVLEKEEMDLQSMMREYIILRLRLKDGLNYIDFKNKFKVDFYDTFKEEIEKLYTQGLIVKTITNIYLSDRGEDLANIVWQEFI